MEFDIKNFRASARLLKGSAGDFKAQLKARYGKKYTAKQYAEMVDKYYGSDKFQEDGDISTIPKKSKKATK